MRSLALQEVFTLLTLLLPVLTLLVAVNIVVYIVKREILKSTIKRSAKVFAVIAGVWIIIISAFALISISNAEKGEFVKFVKPK